MADLIKLKRSAVEAKVPTTAQLELGEIAVNTFDGKLFLKKDNGTESIVELADATHTHTGTYQPIDAQLTDIAGLTPTKGHLIVGNGTNFVSVGVGTNDQVLTADSAQTPGIKWATASGGGGADTRIASFPITPAALPTTAGTTATNQLAIGDGAVVAGNNSNTISVGKSYSSAADSIAICIGNNTSSYGAKGTESIAIGNTSLASGARAVVIGRGGCVGSQQSSIAIGSGCSSTGLSSVCIGTNAQASGTNVINISSNGNVVTGSHSVLIGSLATNSSGTAAILIGRSVTATGDNTIVVGENSVSSVIHGIAVGRSATVSVGPGSIALGSYATTTNNGEFNLGLGRFATQGDISVSTICAYNTSSSANPVELGLSTATASTSPTGRLILQNDSSYIFDCDIVALTSFGTNTKSWNLKFQIQRTSSAANTFIRGTPVKTVIGNDGASVWDVQVSADTINGRPKIEVIGENGYAIRWVANIRMTKVSF